MPNPGGKTVEQIRDEERAFYDAQPTSVSCAWCSWTFSGTAEAARDAARLHRTREHPEKTNGKPVAAPVEGTRGSGPQRRKWNRETILAAFKRWAETHDGKPPRSTDWLTKTGGLWPSTSAVQREFGSWSRGVIAAGFEPQTRGGNRHAKAVTQPSQSAKEPPVSLPATVEPEEAKDEFKEPYRPPTDRLALLLDESPIDVFRTETRFESLTDGLFNVACDLDDLFVLRRKVNDRIQLRLGELSHVMDAVKNEALEAMKTEEARS